MSANESKTPGFIEWINGEEFDGIAYAYRSAPSDAPIRTTYAFNELRQAINAKHAIAVAALETENAELRADAGRYRALIDATEVTADHFIWQRDPKCTAAQVDEDVDAIFRPDAARAGK